MPETKLLVGCQTPRILFKPPSLSSAGQDAVDLAASAGLMLDPWQQLALDVGLAEREDGKWSAFEVGLIVARQNGKNSVLEARELAGLFLFDEQLILHSAHEFKALDVCTPMLTSRGWTTMGELADGDFVYAPDGQLTEVTKAHPIRTGRPCYQLTFDDGQTVVADEDHLWAVEHRGKNRVLSTKQIIEKGILVRVPGKVRDRVKYQFRLAIPTPLAGEDKEFIVDPWLLGAWLGDGTTSNGDITSGIEDLEYLKGRLDDLGETYRIRPDRRFPDRVFTIIIKGLYGRLKMLGLLGYKTIPIEYATASIAQRRELLAGIMDTDGTVSGHQINVTMISKPLMGQIASLVRSLGYKASLREFRASLNGVDAGPMYRVQFCVSQEVSPFGLPRKSEKVKPKFHKKTRSHYNAIVKIEPVESRPTRCITVAHPSSCYLAGEGFIPTHNTAKEAFTRICRLIQNNPALASRVKAYPRNPSEFGIDLHTGQRLRFIARSSTSGRGYTADVAIMDEAFKLNAEAMAALLPTLSSRPNPQVWYTSSAAMENSEQLHAVRKRAIAGEDTRLAYMEWSAPEDCDPYDKSNWALANPALGIRMELDFIEAEAQALTEDAFRRERLSIPDEMLGEAAISPVLWDICRDRGSKLDGRKTFAVDMTLDRRSASISVAGRRADGLIHVEVIDNREGTSWIVPRLQELTKRYRPDQLLLDAGGPAGSILRDLQDLGIEPKLVGLREFAQACGAFYDSVVNNEIRHIGQPSLDIAISGAIRRKVGDLWTWNRAGEIDTSPLVSSSIAFWGVTSRKGRTRAINLAAILDAANETPKETPWQPQEISPLQQTSQEDSTERDHLDQ